MIFKFKNFYHCLVRTFPQIFAFFFSISFIFFIKKISKKKYFKKKILVLNKDRFWEDLYHLDKSEKILFIYFEKKKLSLLSEPFVKTIRKKMKSSYWFDYKNEYFFNEYLLNHSKFIFYFLKYLDFFIKFDLIITPSLWYLQDQPFQKAANLLDKKFIFLHKENTVDLKTYEVLLKSWKHQLMKFEPISSIVVFNNNVKKLLEDTKTIDSRKIYNLGCPRIDKLIKINNHNPNKIMLVSFPYTLGSYIYDKNNRMNREPFKTNDDNLILFFNSVHSTFIDLASKNEKYEFIIKLKYESIWYDLVKNLKSQKEKELGKKINNLNILSKEFSMSQILEETKLVVGINSLSLVEARMIGIPCIIPNFKEISNYQQELFFTDYFHKELTVVNNENELSVEISKNLQSNFKKMYTKENKNFIEEYFGYIDGKNSDRYINLFLNDEKK